MYLEEICKHINFNLQHLSEDFITKNVQYENITSPFSRLYFVVEGEGELRFLDSTITMEANNMFLVPSFTKCNYYFKSGLKLIYIHFSYRLDNGLNIYDLFKIRRKVKYSTGDFVLAEKLLLLHPKMSLPSSKPDIYQTKQWLSKRIKYSNISQFFESNGIMAQLLSRFLLNELPENKLSIPKNFSINRILKHIQENLKFEITVNDLAASVHLSKDHFSRVFKKATGFPPGEFILRKRIEQAQFLLLTSNYTHSEICEELGFNSTAYFSRFFKKQTGITPGQYRNMENR